MKKIFALTILALSSIFITSCDSDDDATIIVEEPMDDPQNVVVVPPATYVFDRDGESTVSFSGQTSRILMAEELIASMRDFDIADFQLLLDMYANENDPFENQDLNESDRNVRGKIADSEDYFEGNAAASAEIKQFFEDLMAAQIDEVFPATQTAAAPGVAGQIADGGSTRYVNAQGLEYNQAVTKGFIGALMVDQALNNYLSTSLLDAGTNREDNDNDVLSDGDPYTNMEHFWDEAYGYAYGTSVDLTNPNLTIGDDDSFLSKYIGRVEDDTTDFGGIAADIFDAYKLGRAAIAAKNYTVRDEQATILRDLISQVIGIRSVYYLQQGRMGIENNDFGASFHDLSEGFGFIYSLQFTRNTATNAPYFSNIEVLDFIDTLTVGDGFWDLTPEALNAMSETIAERFTFTVDQAGTIN